MSAKVEPASMQIDADRVPDVRGMPLRKAIEILARQGVVPKLEGRGAVVQRQSPSAGDPWPGRAQPFTLWLKGYAESRITSYNVCYTKLLRGTPWGGVQRPVSTRAWRSLVKRGS